MLYVRKKSKNNGERAILHKSKLNIYFDRSPSQFNDEIYKIILKYQFILMYRMSKGEERSYFIFE